MSARFHSNLAAYCLLIYDLYMVHVTDDASFFRILNSYSTYKAPLNKCLKISTPADLKTLQWLWPRNKVTAYKAPLYTNFDQELKVLFENPLWKYHVQGCILHVWSENPAFEYWTKQVPINHYSWIQNQWTQSSCPGVSITASNLLFTSGWINVRPFGILFTPGYCSLRADVRLRR